MTGYDAIAELYDEDMGASAPAGDVEFYLAKARETSGRTLELGCGTGRITLPLAAAGCEVIGADRSLAMLGVLRRKAREQRCKRRDKNLSNIGCTGRICSWKARR